MSPGWSSGWKGFGRKPCGEWVEPGLGVCSPLPIHCLTLGKSQAFLGSCFLICLVGGVIICTLLTQELVGPPL